MNKPISIGKINIFYGSTDHWGFGIDYCHHERAFTIDVIHWYVSIEKAAVEVEYKKPEHPKEGDLWGH